MPSTYREKVIAAVGFGAVFLLVLLAFIGGNGGDGAGTIANPPPPIPSREPPPVTTAPQPATGPPPATTTGRQPQPGDALLVVTATRGESALAVRADSEDGKALYEGVLVRGRSISLFGPRLWIRLGAAENVDLTLDDHPVERLQAGPIDLIATPGQLQAAG